MDAMMYWDFWWLMLGGTALLLAVINLIRAVQNKHGGWQMLLFLSLSCGALAMLFAYLGVYDNVKEGDWSSLMDVTPVAARFSGGAMCVGILLNLAALCVHRGAGTARKEAGGDVPDTSIKEE